MSGPVKMRRVLFATAVAAATVVPFTVSAPPAHALSFCSPGYTCTWEYYNNAQHLPPVVGWQTYNCDTTVSSWGKAGPYVIFTKNKCPGVS